MHFLPNFQTFSELFDPERGIVIESEPLRLAYPFLFLQFNVLLGILEGNLPFQIRLQGRVGKFLPEAVRKFELRICVTEIPDQLQGMEQGMVLRPGLEHYLITVAQQIGRASCRERV